MEEEIITLVAKDGFSLNGISNSDFLKRDFKKRGWMMPSNNSIKKIILEKSNEIKIELKQKIRFELDAGTRFSFSTDEWTSIRNKRYISIDFIMNFFLDS